MTDILKRDIFRNSKKYIPFKFFFQMKTSYISVKTLSQFNLQIVFKDCDNNFYMI